MNQTQNTQRRTASSQSEPDTHSELKPHVIDPAVVKHQRHNILTMAIYLVAVRISWIFKTESVIMPAFFDAIALSDQSGWLRGCLPTLNRIGHSVPQLILAGWLRDLSIKKWVLFSTTLLMAFPFITIAILYDWLDIAQDRWLPYLFLMLYLLFFCATGMNVLTLGTLQGKLIQPNRRGFLLSLSGMIGSVGAITTAWLLLPRWLKLPGGGFDLIFMVAGGGFLGAAFLCLILKEPPDHYRHEQQLKTNLLASLKATVRNDDNFKKLLIVAMLFISAQILFPHYQALARAKLHTSPVELVKWVIAQNFGVGLFSLIVGAIADRYGNRLAVRICLFGCVLPPILALICSKLLTEETAYLFTLTFFLLGITPVTFRTLTNYTLELTHQSEHPRYLSTLKLSMALPLLFSPLIGLFVDRFGFELIFISITLLLLLGGLYTFQINEPRDNVSGTLS